MNYPILSHLCSPFHKKIWSSLGWYTKSLFSSFTLPAFLLKPQLILFRDRLAVGSCPFSGCSLGAGFPCPGTTLFPILFAFFLLNQSGFNAASITITSTYTNKNLPAAHMTNNNQSRDFLDYLNLENDQYFSNSSGGSI